jgi:hypothetical protein
MIRGVPCPLLAAGEVAGGERGGARVGLAEGARLGDASNGRRKKGQRALSKEYLNT